MPIYPPKIPNPRVVQRAGSPAYWMYNESAHKTFPGDSGDVPDLMRGLPAATRSGDCAWAVGPWGPCLSFNGSGALTLPANHPFAFERTTPFSVAVRVCPTGGFYGSALIGCLDPALGYRGWEFDLQGPTQGFQLFLINDYPSNAIQIAFPYTPTSKIWLDVVMTYDGSSTAAGVRMYLDGREMARSAPFTDTLSATTVSTSPLRVGSRVDATDGLFGPLDSVRIHPGRALTPAEVARDFADPDWRLRY